MTTNTNGRGEIVEGLVASGNDRRIKLAGQDHYFNYSRFHDVPHPDRGQLVRVEVDPSGFINRLQVLDDAEASAPSSAAAPAPVSNVTRVGRPLVPDRTAVRLAVLQAAADFCGRFATAREDVKSEHVLPLAERWLRWVEQCDQEG